MYNWDNQNNNLNYLNSMDSMDSMDSIKFSNSNFAFMHDNVVFDIYFTRDIKDTKFNKITKLKFEKILLGSAINDFGNCDNFILSQILIKSEDDFENKHVLY